ncbi:MULTISPECIES: hypothetical protein [Cupriavidus]|uniref:hypothetical protein n=1 Tax=Cupriavidus TaxID=106589 RepID=UPI0010F8063D|nr:hypothetical protein [Cupriavidus sp. 2SB]
MKSAVVEPRKVIALTTLPAEASAALAAAAKSHPKDSFARQVAIDAAIKRVKTQYPEYFRQEQQQ